MPPRNSGEVARRCGRRRPEHSAGHASFRHARTRHASLRVELEAATLLPCLDRETIGNTASPTGMLAGLRTRNLSPASSIAQPQPRHTPKTASPTATAFASTRGPSRSSGNASRSSDFSTICPTIRAMSLTLERRLSVSPRGRHLVVFRLGMGGRRVRTACDGHRGSVGRQDQWVVTGHEVLVAVGVPH